MAGKRDTEQKLREALKACVRSFNSKSHDPGAFDIIPKRTSGNVVEFRVIYRKGPNGWPIHTSTKVGEKL